MTQNTVTVKIASTTNNMALLNGNGSGDKISISSTRMPTTNIPTGVGQTIDYSSLNLLSLILISSNVNFPVYVKTVAGANVSAGTYTDTINVWNYHICGFGPDRAVYLVGRHQPTQHRDRHRGHHQSCLINTANNVNFGSMALVGQFNPINQSITLTCTKSQSYSSYFTNGNNPITGWRRMLSGTSNFLQYQIYLPRTSTVWSSTNAQSGTGTGLAQSIPFTAAINPAQTRRSVPIRITSAMS